MVRPKTTTAGPHGEALNEVLISLPVSGSLAGAGVSQPSWFTRRINGCETPPGFSTQKIASFVRFYMAVL